MIRILKQKIDTKTTISVTVVASLMLATSTVAMFFSLGIIGLVAFEFFQIQDADMPDIKMSSQFIRGDANNDGVVNIFDAIHVLKYLYSSGPEPLCFDAADINDDGKLNISDPVHLLN